MTQAPARRLRFYGPHEVGLEETSVPDPQAGEVRVRTQVSAISPGTERLIYRGEAPVDLPADETLESLSGSLSFPLSYGYAAVGEVEQIGPDVSSAWLGETVFCFHPHASRFVTSVDAIQPVPESVSRAEATLLPTVETAVNFVLDGQPAIGECVGVFGQGFVGLVTTALLAQFPLTDLTTVERHASRRELSVAFGADASYAPGAEAIEQLRAGEPAGRDLTYELSGNPAVLDDAIGATGYDGRIIVGSWYGTKREPLDLGGQFHRQRISIESSQVSTIAPTDRGRITTDRRLAVAWNWLEHLELEDLFTHRLPLEEAPRAYELLETSPEDALGVLFTYE